MTQLSQLALSVQLPDDETFDSFIGQPNHSVLVQLTSFIRQNKVETEQHENHSLALFSQLPHSFYLFGLAGVGKSHLLHACNNLAAQLKKTSVCLSCSELKQLPIEVLDGLEQIDFICLDDIELIAGDVQWQQAIFDLYNRAIENESCLIITGSEAINKLGITLPDLVSRIGWGYIEQVKPLDDDDKTLAIQHRARQRGLMISDEATRFLLNRSSRDMTSLIQTLDILDKASIREQRKVTIPFIKEILNISS